MKWENYAADFDWDGSWRDIYVLETSIDDWQTMFDFLHSSQYEFQYQRYEPEPLPSITEVFSKKYEHKGDLYVVVGDVTLNCHFFVPEQIEFDLDPCEVKGEEQAEALLDFMRQLGRALNKEVILTPESFEENPIFKFSPVTQEVTYFPVKFE